MQAPNPSEWVTLKGDISLPLAAVVLALDLAEEGRVLSRAGDQLLVSPQNVTKTQLTQPQREAISQWKLDLLRVVDYMSTATYGPDGLVASVGLEKPQPKRNQRNNSSK